MILCLIYVKESRNHHEGGVKGRGVPIARGRLRRGQFPINAQRLMSTSTRKIRFLRGMSHFDIPEMTGGLHILPKYKSEQEHFDARVRHHGCPSWSTSGESAHRRL